METKQLQQELFNQLKRTLPVHISLVDELCSLLDMSADSAYRRIRGEKPIMLSELKRICEHYHLSLDQLLQLKNDSVLFRAPGITNGSLSFRSYMEEMLAQFRYFNSFDQGDIYYLCKDAPFWYFYLFPEMASFKTFFWCKTINNEPALADKLFSLREFPFEECFLLGQQILAEHGRLNTVELWNLESINSTINQMAYYRDAGIFKSKDDLFAVADSFIRMLDHLQAQAVQGKKLAQPGAGTGRPMGAIQFYINELILGNNTILLNLDGKMTSMITYSVFNYLMTQDERFSAKAFETFNTLLSRSTLVSRVGEKDRNRFFNTLRDKVNKLREG
ncbi:MAG: hypothetical protein J0H74_10630 [Chitinophagaceae bacterium]|nr:hypothetical protein [Chitinophagaceae bacterium]